MPLVMEKIVQSVPITHDPVTFREDRWEKPLQRLKREYGREVTKVVDQADHLTILKQAEEYATEKKNGANEIRLKKY
ncbi:hypothetical protein BELL_0398g00150 [Botrytis elliptica]|uniref:Uncharacterized protein n=1 Tax=Botrytis elliptica TaxID=278938 RepID=A0A4Z1JHQ1_9HELO|nr:hypothetical protein BELL_0398g00150 [Botrytis elliptica]